MYSPANYGIERRAYFSAGQAQNYSPLERAAYVHQQYLLQQRQAKAFAFEIAWMKAIREHNIGNLAGSIETGILSPANNGIHDVAFNFVRGLLKEKTALEAYWEIAAGHIFCA